MARLLYGATSGDYTMTSGGRVIPNAPVEIWDAIEGGNQITDLTDYDGNPVTVVTSGSDGLVRFYGPPGENDNLWMDTGQGSRLLVRPTVLTSTIADGSILDEDIAADADIAPSKIAGTAVVEATIRTQAAGGTRATGPVHIIGAVNAVAPDLGTAVILGGGSSVGANHYENVIGAATTANVGTPNSNLPVATGTQADWSVIVGGYDNVVNGWACVVAGYHHAIEATANHCTISGGATGRVGAGIDYATISGGVTNTVTGDWAVVGGGVRNTAAEGAVAAGGTDSTASGTSAVVGGGQTNTASGIASVVAGGTSNQATTNYSTVSGGTGNSATTGTNATVAGGTTNTASNVNATVGGGGFNTASGSAATVAGGQYNTASATSSTVVGGQFNVASGAGAVAMGKEAKAAWEVTTAFGGGKFAVNGDAQAMKMILRKATTDATPTELLLNTSYRLTMDAQTTWAFSGLITARRTDADDESAGYQISGVIDRNTSGGSVALVGTPTVTVLGEDSAGWDVAITADATYSSLKIAVTGEAGKTIQWVAAIDIVSTTG